MDALQSEGPDRRRHPRAPLGAAADIIDEVGECAPASVRDISMGGACLLSERPLPVGSTLDIKVTSGRLRGVRLRARVVQAQPEGGQVGVRFSDAPSRIESMIQETVLAELGKLAQLGALAAAVTCA